MPGIIEPMSRFRQLLKIFGAGLILALIFLLWYSGKPGTEPAITLGEEVYAAHDCTDCHLSAHILNEKRSKKQAGLIRVRRDWVVLRQFLETDPRHRTFIMISETDRRNLVEYLRSLLVIDGS